MNLKRVWLIVLRAFKLTFRGIDPLTDFFYWPLYDIILWGFAGTWMATLGGNQQIALVMLTSLVLSQASYRSNMDVSFNLLQEMWSHNLLNLFVTPLTITEWVFGVMVTGGINACVCTFFGVLAVWFLYGLSVFSLGWALLPLFLMLIISGWVIGIMCAVGLILFGSASQKLVWVMGWFFVPFNGIFYPIESMPVWAQAVAYSVPMSYFFKVLRTQIQSGRFDMPTFLMGSAMNIVYLFVAIAIFSWAFRRSCVHGLARLEGS